ncbi:MAG: hypothetical protein Q4D35_03040 [Ruminococcus sp.]|nr:hypothetical protein [Ruminococcus sp.]
MKSINFNTGYKEYIVNGDESCKIRINLNDANIPARVKECQAFFDEMSEKYKDVDDKLTAEELTELDRLVREKINYAFGTDICTPAFGSMNVISPVGSGELLFVEFFNAFMPVVEEDMKSMAQAQAIHIEDKVSKYIQSAQTAPVAPAITVNTAPAPDISHLTQEQKDAMLIELMRQSK